MMLNVQSDFPAKRPLGTHAATCGPGSGLEPRALSPWGEALPLCSQGLKRCLLERVKLRDQ